MPKQIQVTAERIKLYPTDLIPQSKKSARVAAKLAWKEDKAIAAMEMDMALEVTALRQADADKKAGKKKAALQLKPFLTRPFCNDRSI